VAASVQPEGEDRPSRRYPDEDVSISVVINTIRSTNDALVLEGEIAALLLEIPTVASGLQLVGGDSGITTICC